MAETRVWTGISDIPSDLFTYHAAELETLLPVWREVKGDLDSGSALREFNARLARQWSIETGILERLYTVDRGTTQLLIEEGFDASLVTHGGTNVAPEQLFRFITTHREALEGLFEFVKGDRPMSTSYIKELHVALTRAQDTTEAIDALGRLVEVPLVKGDWKRTTNNPVRGDGTVFVYCPPEHVASEMEELVRLYRQHLEAGTSPEVNAAWLHHRFAQIHPFQDGNGRVARALATVEFLRAGLFPLVIERDQRVEYIDGLEEADGGNLRLLVDLFADIERRALIRALGFAQDAIQTAQSVEVAVKAFATSLKSGLELPQGFPRKTFALAKNLATVLVARLESVRVLLDNELRDTGIQAEVTQSTDENDTWYRVQIVETARALDYYANLGAPRFWVRLHMRRVRADLVFSFHGFGYEQRGIMACSAFTTVALSRQADDGPSWHSEPACDRPFTFSHGSTAQQLEDTFTVWVDHGVQVALETFRRYQTGLKD